MVSVSPCGTKRKDGNVFPQGYPIQKVTKIELFAKQFLTCKTGKCLSTGNFII